MKKFYLYLGGEQMGPFNIDDLKEKNIKKETSIWHEGLSDWTTAGEIDDLKELFKTSTPPPFIESKKMPPPIKNITQNQTTPQTAELKKKKSYFRLIIIPIVLILGGGAVMMMNNPNAIPGVKIEINTPKPQVVTSRADGKGSGLLNARTTVYATVMNQGGDGNVLVTFYVFQGSKKFDRTKTLYLAAGQSKDLEMTFEEVDYVSGDITYNVESRTE